MIIEESTLVIAARRIVACERDLRHTLSAGQMRDLLMDNTRWDRPMIEQVVASLTSGHGVGAFTLAEARRKS